MICIKCGYQNPQGINYCESCGALLPKMPDTEFHPPPKVNQRFSQLKEAGEKAKSGEMSVEDFAAYLENVTAVLAQKAQEIHEIEIPPEALDDFAEELEVGFAGIELYEKGIAEMKQFVEDQNAEHIDQGIELIRQGNDRINEAMRINRENRRKLEEMSIDTSQII